MSEMNEIDDYTDDQVEAILNASTISEDDFALASFVAEARSLAIEPVDADLARRHVTMLARAAHLTSSRSLNERGVEGRPGGQANTVTPITGRRRRLVTKAAVVGLAAVLMGGGIASAATGNLPAPAQAAIAGLAAHVGIDIPSPDDDLPAQAEAGQSTAAANRALVEEVAVNADLFTAAVQDAIRGHINALNAWTECVADNASGRMTSQGNPGACGEKPNLVIPGPFDFGLGSTGESGPAFDVPPGPPEDVGPPEGAGPTGGAEPPKNDGPPEDVGPPEDAGQPANPPNGPPPDRGPPAGLP